MKPRLIIVFALMVAIPLGLIGWLGVEITHRERERVQERFRELLEDRLRDADKDVAQLIAERERSLLALGDLSLLSADALRAHQRDTGFVRQFFVLDADGVLTYPNPGGPLTSSEEHFIARTRRIWENDEIPGPSIGDPAAPSKGKPAKAPPAPVQGWHTWYWGSGINLIFWWRDRPGRIVGAELDPARLLADLIGRLPDTGFAEEVTWEGRAVLVDSEGDALYQWGEFEPADDAAPDVQLALSPPLSAWRFAFYSPPVLGAAAYGGGIAFNVAAGFAALACALVALSVYFYREHAREMREARQRVSFVNHVSHELKTPLTNIRMYAELLDAEADDSDDRQKRRLDVIVSESQRLSRLIGNVLTFSRKQRSALKLHKTMGSVDEALQGVIEQFRPALKIRGIKTVFTPAAKTQAVFDRDALDQIVANLLNNVEKYAASATRVEVASQQNGDRVAIRVADDGPGIPARDRERVFEPFYRVSNKLTDGVAGTGIGLAIARDLARLHGGDLTLERSTKGACFKLTLEASQTTGNTT